MSRQISILHFLRTGNFGPLRLGTTAQAVHDLIGAPDAWADFRGAVTCWQSELWKYGDFEFHFSRDEPESRLTLIHLDDGPWGGGTANDVPTGGARLRIDSWVIRAGMSLETFTQALSTEGIDVGLVDWPFDDNTTRLRTCAGVEILFIDKPGESDPPPGLCMITFASHHTHPLKEPIDA